jgi:hypothetical protein
MIFGVSRSANSIFGMATVMVAMAASVSTMIWVAWACSVACQLAGTSSWIGAGALGLPV